ncbi:MAG: high-affinity branched-chain amino acid ABC transporter permease LivM [Delftia acidovorans]|nr:MAG: high-affinity branched-chain amino acid ABC transporter permease LivM [Delftia acidovorans]
MKTKPTLNLRDALIATVMTAVVVTPIFGLHLERAGTRTIINPDWTVVAWACALVFLVQLLRPLIAAKMPKVSLPSLPQARPSHRNGLMLAALLIAVSWPFFAGRNAVDIATLAMIYVMLGLGLNIVVGFAGLLDLGFVGFYAVGAYTYALLFHWAGWSFWEALPLAGAAAAMFGFVLGFPVLRLRGDYLAIVTLGFGEIIRLVLENWSSFSQGPSGIANIERPGLLGMQLSVSDATTYIYYLILAAVIVTILAVTRLKNSRIGRAWQALREDEIACQAMGIDITTTKLTAFALGACWAGFAGVIFAAKTTFINPASFTFLESAMVLAMVVLGGMGSVIGVSVGALVLILLPEYLRAFSEYRMLIFGATMVLMMVFRPQGLVSPGRTKYNVPDAEGAGADAARPAAGGNA